MAMNPHRLEFAATVFVRECLRQFVKLHPKSTLEEMPIKAFAEYHERDRKALMAAIEKAVEASAGMDDAYHVFLKQKIDLASANAG